MILLGLTHNVIAFLLAIVPVDVETQEVTVVQKVNEHVAKGDEIISPTRYLKIKLVYA